MRKITVVGLSASRGSGAVRHGDAGAKEIRAARCPKTGPPLARAPAPTVRAPKQTINSRLVELPGVEVTIEEKAWFKLQLELTIS